MTRPPLRIEIALPSLVIGGMEVIAVQLARAFVARGHTVGVTCTEEAGSLKAVLEAEGIETHLVPVPGLVPNVFAGRLRRWFEARRPDVVHIQSEPWVKVARAARQAGVACVGLTQHGVITPEPWHALLLRRWAIRSTDWVATVSQPLLSYLVGEVGLPAGKVRVIINGVDTRHFAPGPHSDTIRARIGVNGTTPLIGIVARLAPEKDHATLLEAFTLLARRMPEARLAIVGDGPERAAIAARIAALGIAERAHLLGSSTDTAPIYRDLDAFVLSSLAEGTSMSILEAMASGVPVVATAVGGNIDVLDEGRCGLLVPPQQPAALADALYLLLTDREKRERLTRGGRERVLAQYSESSMVSHYEELYYASLQKHGRGAGG